MFANAKLRCERDFLHHDPNLAPRLDTEWGQAKQPRSACVGLKKPEQQRNCGGFAGAIRPEYGEEFAWPHLQIEAVESYGLSESFFHARKLSPEFVAHDFFSLFS
jgi:hypothetical protein